MRIVLRIQELSDSIDWWKNRNVEPDEIFALPDQAVYNEPREVRQNIFSGLPGFSLRSALSLEILKTQITQIHWMKLGPRLMAGDI